MDSITTSAPMLSRVFKRHRARSAWTWYRDKRTLSQQIVAELVLSHVSENSVLDQRGRNDLVPFRVGARMRIATCSGVSWIGNDHLAVVNLYGGHLRIYRFHSREHASKAALELLHEMSDGVSFPEDVAASPDGRLLAITHSMNDGTGVSLHRLELPCLAPGPAEPIRSTRPDTAFHGIAFSADSRFLAFTEIGKPGHVEVVRTSDASGASTCRLESPSPLHKPKSIAFTSDGRFAVVAFGPNAAFVPNIEESKGQLNPIGRLAVYEFDDKRGEIDSKPVATFDAGGTTLGAVEICTVLPSESGRFHRILIANQSADVAPLFVFDAKRRTLAHLGIFATGLCFPHGIDASPDGRHVAITNYGNDSLLVARVRVEAASSNGGRNSIS